MTYETLITSVADRIATVTVNRPDKLNALNAACKRELRSLLGSVKADPSVRAVVLTGAGPKAFMAGTDIGELASLDPVTGREFAAGGQALFDEIQQLLRR